MKQIIPIIAGILAIVSVQVLLVRLIDGPLISCYRKMGCLSFFAGQLRG